MQLTIPKVKEANVIQREQSASKHINILGHYDDTTLIDKNGRLIKLFKLRGLDFVTKSQLTLDIYKQRRNSLLKGFNSQFGLYQWIVRRRAEEFPQGEFHQLFSKSLNDSYRQNIQKSNLFENVLYLALVAKAPEGKVNQFADWLRSLSHKVDKASRETYFKKTSETLTQASQHLLSALQAYQIRLLGVKDSEKGYLLSEGLSFISELINAERWQVPLLKQNAAFVLPRKRLFFNARSGTIELRAPDNHKRFAAMLCVKNYTSGTYAGLLDGVQRFPMEMIITQSFRFFDPHAAKSKVKNQQKDFQQIQDESISQTEQLSESLDDAASGEAGFGLHHLSILCLANDQTQLNKQVADIVAEFSKLDITCVREDIACEMAFWAQLPANFAYVPREASVSTKNLSGFMSLHNDAKGKKNNNHWGNAVTVLETISGGQYFFNHHFKDVANTLIFGAMGSGKTLLMGFLLAQSLKFGGKRVVFDKDRGLEILVCALGGLYEVLSPGIPTGFNPCQLKDTPRNRAFLQVLFKKMLTVHGQPFDESDSECVNKAIDRMYTLPFADRQLRHVAPYLGVKTKGSLRARFDEWHSDGEKAWLFDNETDQLNLNADVLGFELGEILKSEECKTPTLMYLMHRIQQAMKGQPGAIYIDEGWLALQDDYFKQQIDNESRTPRKKNRFLCLATQAADDAAQSSINSVLCANSPCKIFFPNPTAKRETYIDKLGLSEREYELVKTLDNDGHYFLLNFGYGKESVVVRLPLHGMLDEIAVISGRESTVQLLDKIRARVGNDPAQWLPIFKQYYDKVEAYV